MLTNVCRNGISGCTVNAYIYLHLLTVGTEPIGRQQQQDTAGLRDIVLSKGITNLLLKQGVFMSS